MAATDAAAAAGRQRELLPPKAPPRRRHTTLTCTSGARKYRNRQIRRVSSGRRQAARALAAEDAAQAAAHHLIHTSRSRMTSLSLGFHPDNCVSGIRILQYRPAAGGCKFVSALQRVHAQHKTLEAPHHGQGSPSLRGREHQNYLSCRTTCQPLDCPAPECRPLPVQVMHKSEEHFGSGCHSVRAPGSTRLGNCKLWMAIRLRSSRQSLHRAAALHTLNFEILQIQYV